MEGESSAVSVFMLLEMACLEMASVSHKLKLRANNKQFYPRFILIRMMWGEVHAHLYFLLYISQSLLAIQNVLSSYYVRVGVLMFM